MKSSVKILVALGVLAAAIWIALGTYFSSTSSAPEASTAEARPPSVEKAAPKAEGSSQVGEEKIRLTKDEPSAGATVDPSSRRERIKSEMVVMGGLAPDVVFDFMERQNPQLSGCYEKFPAPGRLIVRLTISPLGRVTSAAVDRTQTTVQSVELERCVLGALKRAVFPEPQGGGSVEVDYPFTFPLIFDRP